VIKKKVGNKGMNSPLGGGNNGMLAALNPSGTIHVTGVGSGANQNNSTISMGMMSTDFKSTMKHNSSNNSIQSTKKTSNNMIATIRKPTDFIGAGQTGMKGGKNYMSPYSHKMSMNKKDGGARN